MQISIEDIKLLTEIPHMRNECFFCLIDSVQWVSMDLGVLVCSTCVSTLRAIGSRNGSIKLDPNRITNEVKRKVLFNFGYKNEHFKDLRPIWDERIDDIKNIEDYLKEQKEFIEKLEVLSKKEANLWIFDNKESVSLEINKSNRLKKKWQVLSEKPKLENPKIEKISVKIKKEVIETKEKTEPKQMKMKIKKEDKEAIFSEEDSSDVSIDYSSKYKIVK